MKRRIKQAYNEMLDFFSPVDNRLVLEEQLHRVYCEPCDVSLKNNSHLVDVLSSRRGIDEIVLAGKEIREELISAINSISHTAHIPMRKTAKPPSGNP